MTIRRVCRFQLHGWCHERSAKVLAARDLQRLLAHVSRGRDALRNKCIVTLSYRAGLRAKEIAGLDWTMVLRVDGRLADTITVCASIAKNRRRRMLPLHRDLKRVLRMLHARQGRPEQGPVIRSQRGGHMTAKGVVNWFTKIYDEMGFEGCSSHSGRRTFITQAARLVAKTGGSLRDVQELAGHAAITTTERYVEGDREAQRKLVRLMC